MVHARLIWPPYPYRAGFCITDDPDAATLESMRIVYDFLSQIGLRTTRAVWAFEPVEPCGIPALPPSALRGPTLEDPAHLDYCRQLSGRGFEICLHGASAGNNRRERIARAFDLLEREFGPAGTYVCHSKCAENPYWHELTAPRGPAQWLLARASTYRCSGEDPASPYYWGDLCRRRVRHIRLFRTRRVNTLAANPAMPYFDPEKPLVPGWFSATKRSFADCTTPAALERLEDEHGLCVLYQYLHRYADLPNGRVQPSFRADAERLVGDGRVLVDTNSRIMDRLRLVQGLWFARGGREVWLANANSEDVVEVQVSLAGRATVASPAPAVTIAGDVLRVARLAARGLVALPTDPPLAPDPARMIPLDGGGRGSRRFAFGRVFVNVSAEAWCPAPGPPVPPAGCVAAFDDSVADLRPWSRAGRPELYRLLGGQMAILAREILFRGRSLDTRKFLDSKDILLEDHANW
jgi:hypothetical protein